MQYILMHKRLPVAKLTLNDTSCIITKINEIYHEEHLPVGVTIKHGIADRAALNDWWSDRSIPASRSGVLHLLEELKLPNTRLLLTKCFGLSLSDQYWIRPYDREDLQWDDINFFDHDFSEDIGDILLGKAVQKKEFSFYSPDNTSDGCLKKRWKIINGKRCLIKGGSAPLMLQPFHEVVASLIMDKLNIPHVPYTLLWDEDTPYSVCEDFITPDTELITAWRLMLSYKKDNSTSLYQHYIKCCEAVGISDIVHAMDQMIVLDYLIANEDRHLNNFGLIRNAETLTYLGVAPIYDSGSSLGYDKLVPQILSAWNITCKPFKKSHEDQIRLVKDFSWIDFEALENIELDICEVFRNAGMYADKQRIDAMTKALKQRVAYLEKLAGAEYDIVDHLEDDVTEDVAERYASK